MQIVKEYEAEQRRKAAASPEPTNVINEVNEKSPNPYPLAFATVERRCPEYVDIERWQQAVEDGRRFLARWSEQASTLGWSDDDLFGLHQPPDHPHPSYSRLSRYDRLGMIWILEGRQVVILTADSAVIKTSTGAVAYRRNHGRPATTV
jgi:hypothetical protein